MDQKQVSRGRKKRLKYNAVSSLTYQIVAIVCEIILPRLILNVYGSEINGLVNSITQFLGFVAFLELGIGAVVKSALYKPLADKDDDEVSRIMVSAQRFFRNIGRVLTVYVVVLFFLYPYFNSSSFDRLYTGVLILAISLTSFAQYYFGAADRLLLIADQHGYIQSNIQIITFIISTAVCVLLIKLGASIHVVKFAGSIIYMIRPTLIRIYINRHYHINRKITYTTEPIKQKWNGIAQHISAYVLDGTDTIVLTVLSTLENVSIYSIYHLVVFGVSQLFFSLTSGVQSLLGELWAKNETDTLRKTFSWSEWLIHSGVVFLYGCTAVLIVPFVRVYTLGVTDADYNTPLFGFLITLAFGMYCLRMPYITMILAANHYKQTQNNYFFATGMNIVISVILVSRFGLVGVAIGTLAAMVFQTFWMAWYDSKNLVKREYKEFLKQMGVDALVFVSAYVLSGLIPFTNLSFVAWIILGIKVAVVWLAITVLFNYLFYHEYSKSVLRKALSLVRHK